MIELQWGGETFSVLAARALWWPRRRTLCIADVHLGKAAAFRHAGVPVPESTTAAIFSRLASVVERFDPARLVILGDMLHAPSGRAPETMDAFSAWRRAHRGVDLLLIRGNHDARAGDPPRDWDIRLADGPFADGDDGDIGFAHDPGEASGDGRFVLCGHIHPAVSMVGATHGVRATCFWFGERVGVLPAFGAFTGTGVVRPRLRDRVFAIRGDEIADANPPTEGQTLLKT